MRLQTIIEGKGEVAAVPVLLRRMAAERGHPLDVLPPIRQPRSTLAKEAGLRNAIAMAAKYVGPGDSVLVLLDADGDCPAKVGLQLLGWAKSERADRRIGVVLAKNEFENWFVAAARSLAEAGKLKSASDAPHDPESIRDAKGWLGERMARRYSPTIDQPAFAQLFDFAQARACGSFCKLEREVAKLLTPR